MLIKVKSVKNRHLKRFLEHIIYFSIVLVLIPSFFYFEIFVVLPAVVKEGTLEHFIHIFNAIFLLFNIVGNLIFGVFTDTSIKGRILKPIEHDNWEFCSVCECLRPPRSWHCEMCNICILKRDHHCSFFATCVGYFNHRYFLLFTMYVFISMLYALYYNIKFLALFLTWNNGLVIAKFLFPLVSFVVDFGEETIYVSLAVINILVICFTGFLFFYHLKHILKGTTVPEMKHKKSYDKGWKQNIKEVFGVRWYLTWILPFIQSPLPGDGIHWDVEDRTK